MSLVAMMKLIFQCFFSFPAFDFLCDSSPVDTNGLMDTYYETKRALKTFGNNFKADFKWQVNYAGRMFFLFGGGGACNG